MITIRPGYSAEYVLQHLRAAESALDTLIGSGNGSISEYVGWATNQLGALGSALDPKDIDRLITTRHYWAFISTPLSSWHAVESSFRAMVSRELAHRRGDLQVAIDEVTDALSRWKTAGTRMAVVDTNVLMHHYAELTEFDWHQRLNMRPHIPVVVWIPIAAIDELDRLKRDRGNMTVAGREVSRRSVASAALRVLNDLFPSPTDSFRIDSGGIPSRHVQLRLLLDDAGHERLTRVDAEIIDRASALTPFSNEVVVMTYDTGMYLAARAAGVSAVRLVEDDA